MTNTTNVNCVWVLAKFGVLVEEEWASQSVECQWKRSGLHQGWSVDGRISLPTAIPYAKIHERKHF